MKLIKLSLAAALAVTMAYAEENNAFVENLGLSANMTIASDYVWRGTSLTHSSPAIQGGIDFDYNGLYIGVWGSNIAVTGALLGEEAQDRAGKTSLETDVYLGYAGEIGKFSYDIGAVQYIYVNSSEEFNFAEAYLGLEYDFDVLSIGAKYFLGIETNDLAVTDNVEATIGLPLPGEYSMDFTYGAFEDMNDYYYVGLNKTFGKFDFIFAYTGAINASFGEAEDVDSDGTFVVSVGTSF